MQNYPIYITDWGDLDLALPLAIKFKLGLEIQEFTSPRNLDTSDLLHKEIIEMTKDISHLSMHGPFSDLIPASRDPLIRQATHERFMQACEVAQQINTEHLILHSGFIPKTYPGELWLSNSLAFWTEFLSTTLYKGEIHVENVYEDSFINLRELIDQVNLAHNRERITICLDIGHVNSNSSKTLKEWISGLGDRIRYVHLHNNGGSLDDHWQLDKGTIQIEQVLDWLARYAPRAVWTVETPVEDLEPSLVWLQDRGYLPALQG
jgi:sugar phosphate isomerase/epimerase